MTFAALLFLILVTGCAVATAPKTPAAVRERLAGQLPLLPGALVSADGLQVTYPGNSLFAEGAVLPLPGGMAVLDPLAELLAKNPEIRGVGTVRSSGHDGDYDRRLAEKRREVLLSILQKRGVDPDRLNLAAEPSTGAPLEIRFTP